MDMFSWKVGIRRITPTLRLQQQRTQLSPVRLCVDRLLFRCLLLVVRRPAAQEVRVRGSSRHRRVCCSPLLANPASALQATASTGYGTHRLFRQRPRQATAPRRLFRQRLRQATELRLFRHRLRQATERWLFRHRLRQATELRLFRHRPRQATFPRRLFRHRPRRATELEKDRSQATHPALRSLLVAQLLLSAPGVRVTGV